MFIKHDYSLTNEALIDKGYAELSVHSLVFDRHFSEEEMEDNKNTSIFSTPEQRKERCLQTLKHINSELNKIICVMQDKYNIHQLTKQTNTLEHYKTDWDLFFYSNKGWNGEDYFDHFSLTFNTKRSAEANNTLLSELLVILEPLEVNNVKCRIQHTAIKNEEKIRTDGIKMCEELVDKFVYYSGEQGKIKPIRNNGYGFFKKGARKWYTPVSYEYIVLNAE